jgi:hypothetical protein
MSIDVEIIGVEPACYRCKETKENAEKALTELKKDGYIVNLTKLDVMDKSTMKKYGVVRTPALAINGVIKIMGKVPDPGVIERIIRKELADGK